MSNNIYFTADLHLGHKKILDLANRDFDNIEKHDNYIIEKYNKIIDNEDICYILGDICWNQSYNSYKELFAKLNGKKYIILGNHDNKQNLIRCQKEGLIESVKESQIINIGSNTIHLTHYPLLEWFNFYKNQYHLHGHTYCKMNDYCKSTDVGVDCWEFEPVNWNELRDYIDKYCEENKHFI